MLNYSQLILLTNWSIKLIIQTFLLLTTINLCPLFIDNSRRQCLGGSTTPQQNSALRKQLTSVCVNAATAATPSGTTRTATVPPKGVYALLQLHYKSFTFTMRENLYIYIKHASDNLTKLNCHQIMQVKRQIQNMTIYIIM